MRIHYLLTDLNGAGAALPVPDLVRVMAARGHEVRVLALLPRDRRACARFDAVGIAWTLLGERRQDIPGIARELLRRIDADRPDLIWTSLTRATIYGAIAGRLRGIPVVSWQHNAWLKPGNRLLLRLTRRLSALWVADSRSVAEFAAQSLSIPRERIEVWPLFRARADAAQSAPAAAGQRFRIGTLGRLHADKNFRDFIAAAAHIRARDPALAARLEFVIGGDGPEHAALAAQIAAAGLDNVRLAGYIDAPQAFLAGLQAYAQPSHHEGLCIAAHEAMQAALPVVATRVGELQHSILPGRTGALIEVGAAAALGEALMALAGDPAHAAAMGRAGRARVLEQFGDAAFERAGHAVMARVEALVARYGAGLPA
ncbi:MAG: glycosyltransferase [Nevskia sp.]